jgi:pectate lyase
MKTKTSVKSIFLIGISLIFFTYLISCFPAHQTVLTVVLSPEPNTSLPITSTPSPELNRPLPIFPEAEGFGTETIGGRGGDVFEVANLNDSGPGSLRAAVEADGPRIVIFRIAGTIELKSSLVIANPFITIAGQTAPGGGITLRDVNADVEALIQIKTHDVIVRFLTFRAGPPSAGDAIEILASDSHTTYNVVIDHNSVCWAVNRNLATWYDVHDITIQWNIFSEGLNCSIHPKGCHSKGVLIGGYASDENKNNPGAYNISLHHNLMAHNGERNPYIEAAGVIDVVNNVAYNPFGTFSHIDMVYQLAPDLVNYVGNYYKPGPNTEVKYGIKAINPGKPGAGIFIQGNIGPQRESNDLPDIDIVDPGSRQFVVAMPFPVEPITTTTAFQAYDQVLDNAGANKGLNCDGTFFSRRDAIDTRIIDEVRNGTGKVIDDPSQVGGWLTIPPATPCTDSDHDGLPDAWEQKYGFNPIDPFDALIDTNGNGYTNIEEFLNGTNPLQ